MSKRVDIDIENEAVRLYTTKTANGWMGVQSIEKLLGISHATVQNILRRNGVRSRDATESHSGGKRCKPIKNLPVGTAPFCKCGCGNSVMWNRRKNKWNVFYGDHYRTCCIKNIGPNPRKHSREGFGIPRVYQNENWLRAEYESGKTMKEIAKQCGASSTTLGKFAAKFGIRMRPHGEELKRRGSVRGKNNPAWRGGTTPERQSAQKTDQWIELVQFVYRRDGYRCRRCGCGHSGEKKFNAHHLHSWAKYPELRFEASNVVTLCTACHRWVHSRKNQNHEFIL